MSEASLVAQNYRFFSLFPSPRLPFAVWNPPLTAFFFVGRNTAFVAFFTVEFGLKHILPMFSVSIAFFLSEAPHIPSLFQTCCVPKDDLRPLMVLSQVPKCWDFQCVRPYLLLCKHL